MDLVSSYKGVVGLVFGNENSSSNEDSYVEKLLDRIHNGTLCDDRRSAIVELQSVVAESQASQLALGAVGFPVLLSVLKEERDDVEMVRGSLETLVSALTPTGHRKSTNNEIQPALINTDLLSRESEIISLLISFLSEEDFYVRYYTLQLLTALLTNSLHRIQEAILDIPRGITRLMDLLMDREVIRNEALLLLTYLTREAKEIQKIVVFEGVFEKIFSIIKEEGGSDGGVVVQDCLELLNNLLCQNVSNQVLLRETIGFEPVISILKLRGNSFSFTQQKTTNMLISLETINLLILGGPENESGRDANWITNRTLLVQKKALDHLLMLGVESQWAPVSIRRAALHCIGDLVIGHTKNLDALASKFLGEEPHMEPAFNSILRVIMRTSSIQEFIAADYVFMCYCEKNYEGQVMLASTILPDPHLSSYPPLGNDIYVSFGSMLLRGLTPNENDGDLESCCRAASVLSHILKDNIQCKEKLLRIEIEPRASSAGAHEPLMHVVVRYLALAFSIKGRNVNSTLKSARDAHVQPLILKLLVIWLSECPSAVSCFLDSPPHLTYLLEIVESPSSSVPARGLAAFLLGECVLYNRSSDGPKSPVAVAEAISRKLGLAFFFQKLDELLETPALSSSNRAKPHKPLTRTNAGSGVVEVEDSDANDSGDRRNEDHPILTSMFDIGFSRSIVATDKRIRESTVEVYSRPNTGPALLQPDFEQRPGESDREYAARIKSLAEKQYIQIQGLLGGNSKSEKVGREKEETEWEVRELRRANEELEGEVRALSGRGQESEAELNDLLVCLGQEQNKVEKLSQSLLQLGVDVDLLLDEIADPDPDSN